MDEEFKGYIETYEGLQEKIMEKEEALILLKKKVKSLRGEIEEDVNNLYLYGKDKIVNVKLGDILEEVSSIQGISLDDLNVSGNFSTRKGYCTRFNYNYGIDDFYKIDDGLLNIYITDKFDKFDARISFKCLLSDIQNDKRTLLEHCIIKYYKPKNDYDYYTRDKQYSTLLLDRKNAEYVNCHFNLNQIMKNKASEDVLSKAIINVVNRQKVKQKKLVK